MKNLKIYVQIFLLTLSLVAGLSAQSYQGSISGRVTDSTGAVVPGAKVTITNVNKGVNTTLTTTGAGEYNAPSLEPGLYSVTAEASGFGKREITGIRLEVARSIREDMTLNASATTESVTVTAEAPIVDTTSAVLNGTFTNEAINSLPLQGRDFENLVVLRPGIQRSPGGGFLSVTSNGNRYEDNNYIIDGIDDNDAYYGETVVNAAGVEGTPATHLPIDAIQEFNVQESPEADYGFKPGAIIQLGIKSGTNQLHGSALYFHRNAALDARNYFNPKPDAPSALRLHQFGGSLGGPIVKDKLFFFADYEGVRNVVGNPLNKNTPATVSLGGDTANSLPDAIAACTAAGTCSPLSLQIAKLYPFNPGTNPSDPTLRAFDFNNTNREDNGIAKVDYHLNGRNTFSARFFEGDSLQNEEDGIFLQPYFLSQADTNAQVFGVNWAFSATPNVVNQLRFGYNRFWQKISSDDSNRPSTFYGINTGVTNPIDYGFPQIRISGFTSLGGSTSWPLYTAPNTTYLIDDSLTWTKGRHTLKFGGTFRYGGTDNVRDTYGKGRIDFRSLDDFVTGNYRIGSSRTRIHVGDSHRVVTQSSFGGFVMDNWRFSQKLTITAGLRYDLSLPIKEQHDLIGNFDPATGLEQVGKNISQPYNTDYNNFAPRVGFAYDLFGTGKTVLRGGGGIIYEIPHISLYIGQNGADAAGLGSIPTGALGVGNIVSGTVFPSSLNWTVAGPVFGNLTNQQIACAPDAPCSILGVDKNIKTPYVVNWNLNVQQAFGNTTALQVAYVGNRGIKLYSLRDINQNNFALDDQGDGQSGRPFVNPSVCGTHCFPYLGFVDFLENKDNSIYHGLQITLTKRPAKGLEFVAGYTWAHSIDMSSGNRGATWENYTDPRLERGDSGEDIRNRFTLAMTYSVPKFEHFNSLLGGWQINNIVSLEGGRPLDYYDSSNAISGTNSGNDRWNLYGDPHDLSWSHSGIPFFDPGTFSDSNGDGTGTPTGGNPSCIAHASIAQLENYGCYVKGSAILTPPNPGQFGNMRRDSVHGPAFANWDFSVNKTFQISERFGLQLRGEVFNILNHPNFAGVDHDLSDGNTVGIPAFTPDVASSNPVVGSGGSRHIQVGAKIIF